MGGQHQPTAWYVGVGGYNLGVGGQVKLSVCLFFHIDLFNPGRVGQGRAGRWIWMDGTIGDERPYGDNYGLGTGRVICVVCWKYVGGERVRGGDIGK